LGSRYVVLVYTDSLCPFCKRQHNQNIIDKLIFDYSDDIYFVYRYFIVYDEAQDYAEMIECVSEQNESISYFYQMRDFIFSLQVVNKTAVYDYVKKLPYIDYSQFEICVENNKYKQKVQNQKDEWKNIFYVNWTPTTVILGLVTGKYVKILGVFPYEKFEEQVEFLLIE